MCMEDIRLSREGNTLLTMVTPAANTDTLLVPRNPKRISITFMPMVGGQCYISPVQMSATANGILLDPTNDPLTFTAENGAAVISEWHVFSTTTKSIAVLEVTLDKP